MEKKKTKIQSVLLCWNVIPEEIFYYNIPRKILSKEHIKMFRACHNSFINSVISPSEEFSEDEIHRYLSMLSDAICDPTTDFIDDDYKKMRASELEISVSEFEDLLGLFCEYKIDLSKPKNFKAVKLVLSGFML